MTNKLVPTSCVLPFLAIVLLYALDTDYFATAKSVTVFKEYRSVFNSNGKEPPKRWHAEMEGNRVVDDEGIAKTEIKTELNGLRRTETETKKNGVVLEKSMHIEGNNVDGNGKNNSTRHISLDEPKQSPSVMLVNLPVQNGNFMQPQVEKVKIVNEVIPGAERISIKQATNDEKVNEPEKDNEKDSGNSEPIRNRSEGDEPTGKSEENPAPVIVESGTETVAEQSENGGGVSVKKTVTNEGGVRTTVIESKRNGETIKTERIVEDLSTGKTTKTIEEVSTNPIKPHDEPQPPASGETVHAKEIVPATPIQQTTVGANANKIEEGGEKTRGHPVAPENGNLSTSSGNGIVTFLPAGMFNAVQVHPPQINGVRDAFQQRGKWRDGFIGDDFFGGIHQDPFFEMNLF